MKISGETKISEIQGVFHKSFPGLKIKFYLKEHAEGEGSSKDMELGEDLLLNELVANIKPGELSFDREQTVSQLEQQLEKNLGLHAQVFRRSNKLWLQTTATDGWTIKEQNRKGLSSIQLN